MRTQFFIVFVLIRFSTSHIIRLLTDDNNDDDDINTGTNSSAVDYYNGTGEDNGDDDGAGDDSTLPPGITHEPSANAKKNAWDTNEPTFYPTYQPDIYIEPIAEPAPPSAPKRNPWDTNEPTFYPTYQPDIYIEPIIAESPTAQPSGTKRNPWDTNEPTFYPTYQPDIYIEPIIGGDGEEDDLANHEPSPVSMAPTTNVPDTGDKTDDGEGDDDKTPDTTDDALVPHKQPSFQPTLVNNTDASYQPVNATSLYDTILDAIHHLSPTTLYTLELSTGISICTILLCILGCLCRPKPSQTAFQPLGTSDVDDDEDMFVNSPQSNRFFGTPNTNNNNNSNTGERRESVYGKLEEGDLDESGDGEFFTPYRDKPAR